MAITPTSVRQAGDTAGNLKVTVTDLLTDASYLTASGGFVVTAAQLGLAGVLAVYGVNIVTPKAGTGTAVAASGKANSSSTGITIKCVTATAEIADGSNDTAVLRVVAAGF